MMGLLQIVDERVHDTRPIEVSDGRVPAVPSQLCSLERVPRQVVQSRLLRSVPDQADAPRIEMAQASGCAENLFQSLGHSMEAGVYCDAGVLCTGRELLPQGSGSPLRTKHLRVDTVREVIST